VFLKNMTTIFTTSPKLIKPTWKVHFDSSYPISSRDEVVGIVEQDNFQNLQYGAQFLFEEIHLQSLLSHLNHSMRGGKIRYLLSLLLVPFVC